MQKLLCVVAALAAFSATACTGDASNRQVATMSRPTSYSAAGCAQSAAPTSEVVPGYAWSLGARDEARATLQVPGAIFGCITDGLNKALKAAAETVQCIGANMVPEPQPTLRPAVYAAPQAPRADPCAKPPAAAPAPAPTLVPPPPKSSPCQPKAAPGCTLAPRLPGPTVCTDPEHCDVPTETAQAK